MSFTFTNRKGDDGTGATGEKVELGENGWLEGGFDRSESRRHAR